MKRIYSVTHHTWGIGPSGKEYDLRAGQHEATSESETELLEHLVTIGAAHRGSPKKEAKP